MILRLSRLAATEQMDRSAPVFSPTYWRRSIEGVLDLSNGELELLELAPALLRAADQLPNNEVRDTRRDLHAINNRTESAVSG